MAASRSTRLTFASWTASLWDSRSAVRWLSVELTESSIWVSSCTWLFVCETITVAPVSLACVLPSVSSDC